MPKQDFRTMNDSTSPLEPRKLFDRLERYARIIRLDPGRLIEHQRQLPRESDVVAWQLMWLDFLEQREGPDGFRELCKGLVSGTRDKPYIEKLGNLRWDWARFSYAIPDMTLQMLGIGNFWTGALATLVLYRKLRELAQVNIPEEDGTLLYYMWCRVGFRTWIEEDKLAQRIKHDAIGEWSILKKVDLPVALHLLSTFDAVELSEGKVRLVEEVRFADGKRYYK